MVLDDETKWFLESVVYLLQFGIGFTDIGSMEQRRFKAWVEDSFGDFYRSEGVWNLIWASRKTEYIRILIAWRMTSVYEQGSQWEFPKAADLQLPEPDQRTQVH